MGILTELVDEYWEGYRALDGSEMSIAKRTVSENPQRVRLWCRLLDIYLAGMTGIHDVDDPDENRRFARIVRMQFFALGIGHSKSALDAVLSGNYRHAFFSVRYMAELFMQAAYAGLRPEEARRWYKQHAMPYTSNVPPTFRKAFKDVKAVAANKQAVQSVYDTAKQMDEWGAHPSQEALLQTLRQLGEHVKVGAHYDQSLCLAALVRGQFMTIALLQEMSNEVSFPATEWAAQLAALWEEWRTAT